MRRDLSSADVSTTDAERTAPVRVRRAATTKAMVQRVTVEGRSRRPDVVATEEPLEIRLTAVGVHDPQTIAVTMRTPGHDFELAAGYLFTEGIVAGRADVREVRYCVRTGVGVAATQDYNIVTVETTRAVAPELLRRATVTSSSCGLCGTDSIDHLATAAAPIDPDAGPRVAASVVLSLPDALRRAQPVFDKTGGLHGVGLFTADGTPVAVREDVGRHNAVDKVIGSRLLAGDAALATAADQLLVVSGRVSFEIVQKAAMAGVAVLAAVGAPTSLAIDAAERLGLTLVGFVGRVSANVYTHAQRVT